MTARGVAAGERADHHNGAGALLAHQGCNRPQQADITEIIGFKDFAHHVQLGLLHGRACADARVGDQRIKTAAALPGFRRRPCRWCQV